MRRLQLFHSSTLLDRFANPELVPHRLGDLNRLATGGGPIDTAVDQAGLLNVNLLLWFLAFWPLIDILQGKYLNNIVEQDHRFTKKIIRLMKGFKAFHSAAATLQGTEVVHMIRKSNSDKISSHPSSNSRRLQHNSVQTKARSWPQTRFATEALSSSRSNASSGASFSVIRRAMSDRSRASVSASLSGLAWPGSLLRS